MIRAALLLLCAATLPAQTGDPAKGRKLYDSHCSVCHGLAGSGGRGPVLATQRLPRAATDEAFLTLIQEGFGAMPGFWMLGEPESKHLIAYVRSLSRIAQEAVPGDPAAGRRIFEEKSCRACHIVSGQGAARGPELSGIGARRSAAYLRDSVLKPAAHIDPEWWVFRAVLADGSPVRGSRLNEDSFTIQLQDGMGRLHSLRKPALRSLEHQAGVSLMPPYENELTPAELQNLIAYLASLRELP